MNPPHIIESLYWLFARFVFMTILCKHTASNHNKNQKKTINATQELQTRSILISHDSNFTTVTTCKAEVFPVNDAIELGMLERK